MRPRSVLVVDGDLDSCAIFHSILEHEGYEVLAAANGVEALALVRTSAPDLIIREHPIRLPDGSTLAQTLKADPLTASIPILTITARVAPGELDAALRDHSLDVLAKPIIPRDVAAHVRSLIGAAVSGATEVEQA